MKKILFLLFFSYSLLYSCATCLLMVPTAEIAIKADVEKQELQKLHFTWKFSDLYTQEMTTQYDKNKNQKLDANELNVILEAMLEYLIPKNMLTQISYAQADTNATNIEAGFSNYALKVENELLIFDYEAAVELALSDQSSLSFSFEDDEGFFGFVVVDVDFKESELAYTQNLYLFSASMLFTQKLAQKTQTIESESNATKKEPKNIQEMKNTQEEESFQSSMLQKSIVKIKSLFETIKNEQSTLSFLLLLLFAYIYGFVHALGPGHGKTLVASYFLSNDRSYSKALFVSLAIGVVHTFSAFILTLIIYFFVSTFLASFLSDTLYYTTKISAFIIIFIALYLLYKKYAAYRASRESKQAQTANGFAFSTSPHISTCGCNSCKVENNSTDFALIVSAGIIPCPGTTTIFIFALSLGLYSVGFISAFVMSLGMSSVIFLSALISVTVRKKSFSAESKLKVYLEYASLFIIFGLGLLLLLA